jgi:hypothetical protein
MQFLILTSGTSPEMFVLHADIITHVAVPYTLGLLSYVFDLEFFFTSKSLNRSI